VRVAGASSLERDGHWISVLDRSKRVGREGGGEVEIEHENEHEDNGKLEGQRENGIRPAGPASIFHVPAAVGGVWAQSPLPEAWAG